MTPPDSPTIVSPLPYLPPDCISLILSYHIFHLLRRHRLIESTETPPYDETPMIQQLLKDDKRVELSDSDWFFIVDYATCCEFHGLCKDITLPVELFASCKNMNTKPVLRYTKLHRMDYSELLKLEALPHLRGITTLDLTDVHFDYRISSLEALFPNLRGIQELYLCLPLNVTIAKQDFENLRGIRKLHLAHGNFRNVSDDVYENLRGISSLCLKSCDFPQNCSILPNLRGIEYLKLDGCHGLSLSASDFRNLRGIRKLVLLNAPFHITEKHLDHLRGIQELTIDRSFMDDPRPLTDASLRNLGGIQKFSFKSFTESHVSDSGLVALRGVKEVHMHEFPLVTSAALEHLGGIQHLEIERCKRIEFKPEALCNLKGLKSLSWDYKEDQHWERICDKLLNEPCLKHLSGVQHLELNGVITVSHKSFRHLSEVRELFLKGKHDCKDSKPVKSAALAYLKNVEKVHLTNMNLMGIRSFPQFLKRNMPKIQEFTVKKCLIVSNSESMASHYDWQSKRRRRISFSFVRNDEGELVRAG